MPGWMKDYQKKMSGYFESEEKSQKIKEA